jgi:hypothetical protein
MAVLVTATKVALALAAGLVQLNSVPSLAKLHTLFPDKNHNVVFMQHF